MTTIGMMILIVFLDDEENAEVVEANEDPKKL